MSALIALILLFGTIWFLSTAASGPRGGREPMTSVTDFSRAMRALDPASKPTAAQTRPPAQPQRVRAGR